MIEDSSIPPSACRASTSCWVSSRLGRLGFKNKTGNLWKSPRWGSAAPYVRMERHFRGSKFRSQQRHLASAIALAYTARILGWVNISNTNFVLSEPKFTEIFFLEYATESSLCVDKPFSACRYLDPFRRHSRSNSKVVRNHAKFLDVFLLSQILGVRAPIKFVPHLWHLPLNCGELLDINVKNYVGSTFLPNSAQSYLNQTLWATYDTQNSSNITISYCNIGKMKFSYIF